MISKLYVTGSNQEGQTGLPLVEKQFLDPRPCHFGVQVVQVSCGYYHTIILIAGGWVYEAGNQQSQPAVLPLKGIVSVAAGGYHSFAQAEDYEVYAWGDNQYGQLGLGHLDEQPKPQRVPMERKPYNFTLGAYHTVIWREGQTLVCGRNEFYQLGLGDPDMRTRFTELSLIDVHEASSSETFTCFLTRSGQIYFQGIMGKLCKLQPQEIKVNLRIKHLCSGRKQIALLDHNDQLYLLNDELSIPIPGIRVKKVRTRSDTFVLQDEFDCIYSWGKNNCGELGLGNLDDKAQPTLIPQLTFISDFDLGEAHAVFLSSESLNHESSKTESSFQITIQEEQSQMQSYGELFSERQVLKKRPNDSSNKENSLSQKERTQTAECQSSYKNSVQALMKDKKIAELQLLLSQKDEIITALQRKVAMQERLLQQQYYD